MRQIASIIGQNSAIYFAGDFARSAYRSRILSVCLRSLQFVISSVKVQRQSYQDEDDANLLILVVPRSSDKKDILIEDSFLDLLSIASARLISDFHSGAY